MTGVQNAPLDWNDIKKSAAKFALRFKDVKKEASYKQIFWSEFLQMFGVDVIQVGMFEYYVKKLGAKHGEIDYFWPGKVIIEHKSSGKDLDAAMDQAMDYLLAIEKKEELPRYIVVSDFSRIRVMDLIDKTDDTFKLEDLPDNVERFGFLAGYSNKRIEGQHPVNVKAAEVMGELYDLLKKSGYPKEDLDILLIRLVFCLFAEDADIFEKNIFTIYIRFHTNEDGSGLGSVLNEIFQVLNTPMGDRQKAMQSELANFPYVNGGLFAKHIPTAQFDREMRDCLLKASGLDWKYISPAIFGSLFQCIMDPEMRRELGAHYTSEENILKLINPLFMDDLRAEFDKIKKNKKELRKFWDKIAEIRIMDPACGCGNFLIISYREMRRLEMDVLDALYEGQMIFDESHMFINHYYGIEIGEFASMVAGLSIILMDHLMNLEMRNRFGKCRDIIPLQEKAHIVCENSLDYDWSNLVSSSELTYIIGNPPFRGSAYQTDAQKSDVEKIFSDNPKKGKIDYVACWHKKSMDYITGTKIKCAFVSTNSIVQGEQIESLWEYLYNKYPDLTINFAYRTFKWSNEASGVAAVHVIILGFSLIDNENKKLFLEDGSVLKTSNITPYLTPGVCTIITSRSSPISDVPQMSRGSQPTDGGNLILSVDERNEMINICPESEKYIHRFMMGDDFINNKERYCLWLVDCPNLELKTMKPVLDRVMAVKEVREKSKKAATRKKANVPHIFDEVKQPNTDFIAVPIVSSENRQYIPIDYLSKDVIAGNKLFMVPDCSLYHFGVMMSSMHMAWMRTVCGRLKSDYSYSNTIVYNNFVWPSVDSKKEKEIVDAVKVIVDERAKLSDMSLGEMYDMPMPESLLNAHLHLDDLVDKAYCGKRLDNDVQRVELLFSLYNGKIKEFESKL